MPLFFAISGILFSVNKGATFKSFFLKRFKQLIVPYFILNIITYLFWLFIGRKFGSDIALNIPIYKPLLGILYGNGIDNYLQHCTSLWFIPCLFIVENIYFIFSSQKKLILIASFVLLGFADYYFALPRLPWGINIAFTAIIFYIIGNTFKNYIIKYETSLNSNALIFGTSLIVLFFLSKINGNVDMDNRMYSNYLLFILSGISGIIMILSCSKILEGIFSGSKLLVFISNGTIVILAFHAIAGSIIRGVTLFIFHIPITIYDNKIINSALYSILSIVILMPLMYVLERYFPQMIGKNKLQVKS